jgi:hypothetical protein
MGDDNLKNELENPCYYFFDFVFEHNVLDNLRGQAAIPKPDAAIPRQVDAGDTH